jgi:hypothetical protein
MAPDMRPPGLVALVLASLLRYQACITSEALPSVGSRTQAYSLAEDCSSLLALAGQMALPQPRHPLTHAADRAVAAALLMAEVAALE